MPPHDHTVTLADWQAEDLAGLLDSLQLWLTEAPPRTLRELADHTDPHWSNTPGSREAYAARLIVRLQRCRALPDPPKEAHHRPPNVTPTPGRGVNFQPLEGGQFRPSTCGSEQISKPKGGEALPESRPRTLTRQALTPVRRIEPPPDLSRGPDGGLEAAIGGEPADPRNTSVSR
jgi:hypothetical protein